MSCYKIELEKALRNKLFWLAVTIGCLFTLLSLAYCVEVHENDIRQMNEIEEMGMHINPAVEMDTLYRNWVGGESFSLGSELLFTFLPLLAALPYGWSFCEERTSGYLRMTTVRTGRKRYYRSKYLAILVSGGLAVLIPLMFSLLTAALFFPALKPIVIYDTVYCVFSVSLLARLYYTHPLLYLVAYLLIDGLFAGLLACVCLFFSCFLRNRWLVTITPFAACFLLHYCRQYVYHGTYSYEISPLYFLRAAQSAYPASGLVIAVEALLLIVLTAGCLLVRRKRNDIL